ncbi:hypothetical protein [Bacillus dakarensis]|uniref:hypothetical protein n=1 Tax=Robertmurraya dakarensis TaxID=1926278 RepID=UPI0009824278|nr:hypothetical protein [Bacillus dakarensis]
MIKVKRLCILIFLIGLLTIPSTTFASSGYDRTNDHYFFSRLTQIVLAYVNNGTYDSDETDGNDTNDNKYKDHAGEKYEKWDDDLWKWWWKKKWDHTEEDENEECTSEKIWKKSFGWGKKNHGSNCFNDGGEQHDDDDEHHWAHDKDCYHNKDWNHWRRFHG